MKLRWIREGEIDDWSNEWHLYDLILYGQTHRGKVGALCGKRVSPHNWTHADEQGWEWIRQWPAKVCLRCVDGVAMRANIDAINAIFEEISAVLERDQSAGSQDA